MIFFGTPMNLIMIWLITKWIYHNLKTFFTLGIGKITGEEQEILDRDQKGFYSNTKVQGFIYLAII